MKIGEVIVRSRDAPYLDGTFSYALTGCARVTHLIGIYQEVRKKYGKTRGRVWVHLSDILRAAVVLCHANLEQVLRDLMGIEAEWNPEFLQRIPLPDSKHPRADRFSLADLTRYGDRPASEIVCDAVFESLSKRSFTEVTDVVETLNICSFDIAQFKKYFPGIQELMERRHHIAHTADIEEAKGRGKQMARSLSVKTVARWNKNVFEFILELSMETMKRKPNKTAERTRLKPRRSP